MSMAANLASTLTTDLTTRMPAYALTTTALLAASEQSQSSAAIAGSDFLQDGHSERAQSSAASGGTDFNQDGQTDLVWRNTATGDNAIWLMRGTQVLAEVSLIGVPDLNWVISDTGDCNRDGHTDIVWRNYSTGENAIWYMNGTILVNPTASVTVADLNWDIEAVTDFNQDGYSDWLWRNYSTGENAIWYMNGATLINSVLLTAVADLNWEITGTGDFNRDGQADIVWRNYRTGDNALWLMNQAALSTTTWLAPVNDAKWELEGSGDFNGDGDSDLLWRNYSRGENAIWYMNGTTRISGAVFNSIADTNWQIGKTVTQLLTFSNTFGYGLVDAAGALSRALARTPLTSTTTYTDVANLGDKLWYLDQIHAPEAWVQGFNGQGIVVAVIDSGVNYFHNELDANIWRNLREIDRNAKDDDGNGFVDDIQGWNFLNGDNTPFDINGHGTQVTGLIAAKNDQLGITGVAYGAKIMPLKTYDKGADISSSAIAAAVYYAVNNGARVINISLGGEYNLEEALAIDYATSQGVVVVASAGNDSGLPLIYPAGLGLPGLIAAGSVDRFNRLSDFSSIAGAARLDYLVAPGSNIYTTDQNDDSFTTTSGTSFSAPLISGVAALLLSARPDLRAENVAALLRSSAQPTGINS
jgi:subtilisin family serine protease